MFISLVYINIDVHFSALTIHHEGLCLRLTGSAGVQRARKLSEIYRGDGMSERVLDIDEVAEVRASDVAKIKYLRISEEV